MWRDRTSRSHRTSTSSTRSSSTSCARSSSSIWRDKPTDELSRLSCLRSILANLYVPLCDSPLLALTRSSQVIVNGNEEAVADLAAACRSVASMTQEIYTPAVGECITVGEETKNFSVRLGDTIMATLKMSRVSFHSLISV